MTLPTKQMTRTHISSFVHSLHLLDLDLCEDWPGISKETFGGKSNLQLRLRCVEWSLYRLFELYDPRTTREKLLPFFPPATSLQSINLRAALFRQLTELKKDGRLGQNVVLRKTMLDECKGDKFEELIAAFSMLVLKRLRKSPTNDSSDISSTRSEYLLPLVIAHRKVIEQDLVKRKELRLRAETLQQFLQAELKKLTVEESETKQMMMPELPENANSLRRVVHENWIGDTRWVDAITNGERPRILMSNNYTSDQPLEDYENSDENPPDVLHDLSSRLSMQNARLIHWQSCLKELRQSKVAESTSAENHVYQAKMSKFSKHQNLDSGLELNDGEQLTLKSQHVALLESLERGLTQSKRHCEINETASLRTEVKNHLRTTNADGHIPSLDVLVEEDTADSVRAVLASSRRRYERTPETPPGPIKDESNLTERTKASLVHLINPENQHSAAEPSISHHREELKPTMTVPPASRRPDRSSLLERTRESMSLLTGAFEDSSYRKPGTRKSLHSKSKSVNVPSQTRKLEKAWSEESKASKVTKDDFDVNASDYDSVFKSRPKLAMSPNLSPQRNDLFDEFLEEGMKKLTIEPTA